MKALVIWQPWAWLIVHRWKPVENRSRGTSHRGQTLILAGLKIDERAHLSMLRGEHPVTGDSIRQTGMHHGYCCDWDKRRIRNGGIVGVATIYESIDLENDPTASCYQSPWFVGRHGYMLRDAMPLPFTPYRGQQGFFDIPDDLVAGLKMRVGA